MPQSWIGLMDKVCGYRYVAKSAADHSKYFSSADLGASLLGKLADGILNGSGHKNPTPGDEFSDLMYEVRIHVKPPKNREGPVNGSGVHATLSRDLTGF